MQELHVNSSNKGKKLINYITSNTNIPFSTVHKLLRNKDIKINGKRVKQDVILYENDFIEIYTNINNNNNILEYKPKIIYEDNNILVCYKPKELEVLGKESLNSYLKKQYDYIEPCHRLDRNTDGVMLFAKNKESLDLLFELFKNHKIEKHYFACVNGIFKDKSSTIEKYLFKDSKKSLVYISDVPKTGYVNTITKYNVIKQNTKRNISLLDITLTTRQNSSNKSSNGKHKSPCCWRSGNMVIIK